MKNINKKIWIVLGIILSVCFIFIGTLTVIINGDKICKNTYINDTNIGELTKEQASEKLKNIYNEDNIEFKYNDKKFIVLAKEIDFYYDIDNTVEQPPAWERPSSRPALPGWCRNRGMPWFTTPQPTSSPGLKPGNLPGMGRRAARRRRTPAGISPVTC